MLCTGIDIVEIARIRKLISRWKEKFIHRIYTETELRTACCNRTPTLPLEEIAGSPKGHKFFAALAARFAAKEAVMKALGTGKKDISWKEIEILTDAKGAPQVQLYGKAYRYAKEQEISNFCITLSHTKEYAVASVVGIRNKHKSL